MENTNYSTHPSNQKYLRKYYEKFNAITPVKSKKLNDSKDKLQSLNKVLLQAFSNNQELSSFLKELLNSSLFSSYSCIHLFSHEKGRTESNHYQIKREIFHSKKEDVLFFQKFYLAVKKSKNRSFGQKNLKGIPFDIIGTFMAREFSIDTHNLIFVLSREDFLEYSKEEINFFRSLEILIPSYLKRILNINTKLINQEIQSEILNTIKSEDIKFKKSIKYDIIKINHSRRLNLLGDLLNTFHHEISNPIFGIQLSTNLLKNMKINKSSSEMIDLMAEGIAKAQEILKDFSNLYKNTSSFKKIDLEALVSQSLMLAKSELKGIRTNIQIDDGLDSISIVSNPTWLSQIIFNLVINSAQAIHENNPTDKIINIKIISMPNNLVEINVLDSGPGVPKSQIPKIFNSFYTTKNTGTGLGLSISKDLALRLGGELRCISSGSMSYFSLVLPYENTSR